MRRIPFLSKMVDEMVMGWTEDFLLKTLTSTEKGFLRVSFHNDGYTGLKEDKKFLPHSHPLAKSIT